MRHIFWLLIVLNLGLLTYFNLDLILPSKPHDKVIEIDPDKIQLLSQQEIEALPKKPSLPTSPLPKSNFTVAACFEWGVFTDNNIASAQNALTKLSLQATVKEQPSQQPKRFWIYRPPLKSAAEAQQKAEEIKALGVQDLFVVQEARWKNAISFGIFEDEQLAVNLLQELQAKGIKNVTKALRTQGTGHSSLILSNLSQSNAEEIKKLKPDFPETSLKEISCTL